LWPIAIAVASAMPFFTHIYIVIFNDFALFALVAPTSSLFVYGHDLCVCVPGSICLDCVFPLNHIVAVSFDYFCS